MSLKTPFAIINNKKISIDDYHKNNMSNTQKQPMYDEYKNELVYVQSKKGTFKPHFRIKSKHKGETNVMTDWHSNWENNFIKYKEKTYCVPGMIKKHRRADIDLNEKQIIEFQHSPIEKEEVDNRLHDWTLCNKEIIWVIDGSDSIEITELKYSKRIFLEFKSEPWKYESFLSYDLIYIDINNEIYKINPKFIKSNMIDVQLPKSRDVFVNSLKKNNIIFEDEKIIQTNIYVKQQGAGNGKTYGIVQLIQDDNFIHYDTFVYLTKQHSAVHVIKNELNTQIERGYLDDIEILNDDKISNKYIINFQNKKSKHKRKIILGTFDSFVYALGNQNIKAVNKFIAMAQSIIDEELKCSRNGNIKYADGIKLNKKLLLIGDEMQDLSEEYIKAVIKITRDRYVDFYGVGDLLQSISIKKNSFRFLYKNELPNDTIKVTKYEPSNICRRFTEKKLVNFVNSIIPFKKKYDLPQVNLFNETDNETCLEIFPGQAVYSHDDDDKIHSEINKIMKNYINEVDINNYKPQDFLIVTPFSNNNKLVDALNSEIRDFWKKKYNDTKYIKHSIFHKSDNGVSIDLTESDNATRIVSIHSSKGDGRPVVFVIGLSENGLKKFSNESNNLIYDSLLHVALTRMKKKLYIRLECNNDDIHQRIDKYLLESGDKQTIIPFFKISKSIKLELLFKNTQKQSKNFDILIQNIINFTDYIDFSIDEEGNRELIDMKHHSVRYIIFYILWVIKIMEETNNENNKNLCLQQIYQIWDNLIKKNINYIDSSRVYFKNLYNKKNNKTNIPILKYSCEEGDYSDYSVHLKKRINKITRKLQKFIEKKKNVKLKVLDTIILYHLMQISDQGKFSGLPISDLYDIIDLYNKIKPDEKELYIQTHYNKIQIISELYNQLNVDYPNLKWLLDHFVYFNGKSSDFEIYKKFNIIAYNDKTVLICYIKPQFSQLIYNEIMIESIYDTFLIKNVLKKEEQQISENYSKFNGKQILTCILSFDCDKPFIFNWVDTNTSEDLIMKNDNIIKNILKNDLLSNFEMKNNNIYLFYKHYFEEFKNNEPIVIIKKIMDKYQKIKEKDKYTKFPQYIDELFFEIKSSIRKKNIDKQLEVLNNYTNKEIFNEELNFLLEEAVNNYFNLN